MSFKFNPTTGQLDLVGAGGGSVPSLKDQILNAPDVQEAINYIDFDTCSQRISEIVYTAASISPTASATKLFTYSNTGFEYEISQVSWIIQP
jgi:hypothetical protein